MPLHKGDVCLSLEKCRSLLPEECDLSDSELEKLRDALYCLAGVAVDGFLEQSLVRETAKHEQSKILGFENRIGVWAAARRNAGPSTRRDQ